MAKTFQRKGGLLLVEGFDISKPAEFIDDRASPNSKNFYVDRGLLRKRCGVSLFGSNAMADEIVSGREFTRGEVRFNVRASTAKIERYNVSTDVWDDITGTTTPTGDEDDIWSMAVPTLSGQQVLCLSNGINAIQKYDGGLICSDLSADAPIAKFIQEYEGYLVAANIRGGIDQGQLLQWPDTFSPTDWTSGNSGQQLLPEGGEDISGLNLFGKFLAVHKPNLIYLGRTISSNLIFQFDPGPTGVGTICNATIVNLPTGEQIFLASDGLRLFNGTTAPPISSPVNAEIRDSLNHALAHKSWAVLVLEKDEVWVGMPIGDQETADTVYKYNYLTGVLYKDVRPDTKVAWRFTNPSTSGITWDSDVGTWDEDVGSWDDGALQLSFPLTMFAGLDKKTYSVDPAVNDDASEPIEALWESKDFEGEIKGELARWLELEIWIKGISVQIQYSIDAGVTWNNFIQSPLSLGSEFPGDDEPQILYFDVVSSRLRLRFINNELGEPLAIKQFILGYRPRERRN